FTHFCLGSVDTRSKQVDISPRFQKTQLPDWESRGFPDLSPSPKASSHPFKRKDKGIPGEKVVVQGKGADPTEEAQEKKDLWHFRCHQSRASPIEENLHRFPSRLLN
ncbi:hypothetical protein Taro_025230, partial [Colocasia esculenta]|nr:hypothetical protein [Colocasia esculenta]